MTTTPPPPSGAPTPPPYTGALGPVPPAGTHEWPTPQPVNQPPASKQQRNVLGIVALAVAALGFIFACIPGALIVGWVLLPIGFILGLVALFFKGKVKWQAITAVIVAVVGTVVGVIVFFAVVATAFDDAFGDSNVSVGEPAPVQEEKTGEEVAEEEPAAEVGTRENPLPIGTEFSSDEWTVVVNSVTLNANDQVIAANQFNDAPDEGTEYILVNFGMTYIGSDEEGGMPAFVGTEYVTAAGVTVDGLDSMAVAPEQIDLMSPLYEGASASGNIVMQVPTPPDGVLAIRPGMFADKVFVAIQ